MTVDMLMCQSIALENLSRTIPPIGEDQRLFYFTHLSTLFGGELAKLQKANTEHASALTVFPAPAVLLLLMPRNLTQVV